MAKLTRWNTDGACRYCGEDHEWCEHEVCATCNELETDCTCNEPIRDQLQEYAFMVETAKLMMVDTISRFIMSKFKLESDENINISVWHDDVVNTDDLVSMLNEEFDIDTPIITVNFDSSTGFHIECEAKTDEGN